MICKMTSSTIKSWLTRGEFEKLEHIVLEGKGARLLGENSPDLRTRVFLKGLPTYLAKINQAHEAVTRGALADLKKLIAEEPKKKLALAKDSNRVPLLHKAVYNDHQEVIEWLLDNYPNTAMQKDREGRTALHYCVACKDPESIWDLLIEGGCDASICDKRGNPASYYLQHASEIELPDTDTMADRKPNTGKTESLDFKPSNIRIWIHNRDIAKLQQVLWEGHGSKLKCEISNNPRVRKFLEATPFIMGTIKQIHSAVVKNDGEGFSEKIAEPVAPVILCSKDMNGLNVLHKAAGLGYIDIAREILEKYPAAALAQDNDGKTPLHYAAAVRDGGAMYDLLVEHGADESKLDNKNKAAAFYKNRPGDIDLSNLVVIPEAPRVSGTNYPKHWDWRILDSDGMSLRSLKKQQAPLDVDSAFGSAESAIKSEESSDHIFGITDTEKLKENLIEQIEPGGDENAEADDNGEEKEPDGTAADGEEETAAAEGEEEASPEGEEQASPQGEGEAAPEDGEGAAPEVGEEAPAEGEDETTVEEDTADDAEVEVAADAEEEAPVADQEEEEEAAADEGEEAAEPEDPIETNESEETVEPTEEEEEEEEKNKADDNDSGNIEEPGDEQTQEEERNEQSTGDSGVDETKIEEDQVIAGEHEEDVESELNDGNIDEEDPEVEDLLVNGSMEQLATVVLDGEGRRLVGRQSSNPELQAFIDNVPSYIGKIHAVHIAAREGNLRDLQNSLDRRKFAIARDGTSPHGATPLHVAVIFGHTSVIRYLGGRFPESAQAVDLDGRTPLHYAATLADNGHYYNLLLHLGANPLTLDNFGQKADYYKENQDDLSHKQLLRDFGAREELADEMLTDKVPGGDIYSARRDINEPDILTTLERCFRLLVSSRRTSMPNTASANAGTMLGRCLKRPVFDRIKHRVTRMDHNLFDVIWPSVKKYSISNPNVITNYSSAGRRKSSITDIDADFDSIIVAPDYESYIVFSELFDPFIRNLQCVTATGELPDQPLSCFFTDTEAKDENANIEEEEEEEEMVSTIISYDIDHSGKYIQALTIDACRNLEKFELPLTLTINQLEETEKRITGVLMCHEISMIMVEGSSEDEAGNYYTLNEILERPSDIRVRLEAAGLLGPILETEMSDEKRLHGKYWPYGRGVYVASPGDIAVWVNVHDHIRIICCTSEAHPGAIGKAYVRIARILSIFDRKMVFKRDKKFGFLSARPSSIGNTMRFCATAKLSGLSKQADNLKEVCITRGLRAIETMRSDVYKISNLQCLSITELQTLQDFIRAIVSVLGLEKEMVLSNSLKIATLITNIFRKRKSSARAFKG